MIKRYTRDDVTVVWQPDLCRHSGVCARGMPRVFNPRRRPWIELEHAASVDEIVEQVAKCPSGALSIERGLKPEA